MLTEVVVGMSCVNRLKSVGEIVEPCGVPSLIGRVIDVPLNEEHACLSPGQEVG